MQQHPHSTAEAEAFLATIFIPTDPNAQHTATLPKGYKEYRLVLSLTGMDGTIVKHQGPRLCSPERAKLYFPQQARTLLGVWTHNSHLLPPNYSACVTGYTNKNIAHILTFEMVRSEVASMISTIAIVCKKQKIPTKKREIHEIPLLSVPFEENESIDKPASKKRKMEPPIPPPPVIFTLQPSILQQIPESIKRNVLSYYSSKLSAIYNS